MFGLLYLTTTFIGATISGAIAASDNYKAIEKGIQKQKEHNNPLGIYIDRKGATRDLKTHELVSGGRCSITGDLWIERGNKKENLSQKWREEFYAFSKTNHNPKVTVTNDIMVKKNLSPRCGKYNYIPWNDKYYCEGQWYKDLNNGRLYVIRKEDYMNFYMDIETRKYIRLADEQIKNIDINKANEIIEKHNRNIDDGSWNILGLKNNWNGYYFNNKNVFPTKQSLEEIELMQTFKPL